MMAGTQRAQLSFQEVWRVYNIQQQMNRQNKHTHPHRQQNGGYQKGKGMGDGDREGKIMHLKNVLFMM